jgi:GntR family transcriptional regulator
VLNPDSAIPLYIQLKDHLLNQIQTGVYAAGSRLPSERELAQSYHLSRMTARMALQLLIQDGIAQPRTGKGTFVSFSRISQDLNRLTGFSEEMERRGMWASSRVVTAKVYAADLAIAQNLRLIPDAEVVMLARVRLANDQPLALEIAYLNHAVCPGILDHDFERESLYSVLRAKYALRLIRAEQTIEARLPDPAERQVLHLDSCDPVLSQTRLTFTELDQPVEYVRSVYRGSAYQLRTSLTYER